MAQSNGSFSGQGRRFQKQQQDPGQGMTFPQSIAGVPLVGQQVTAPLPSLPGQSSGQQFTQISHRIGPLFSGPSESQISELPGAHYSLPATNHYIRPRTRRALKIVHPETHEEPKFDFKSIKGDSHLNSGVATAAGVRIADNDSSHMRHSLGSVAGAQDQMNMNTFSAHQSGTSPHLYHAPLPGVSPAVTGTTSARYSIAKFSQCGEASLHNWTPVPHLSFKPATPGNLGAESSGTSTATVCVTDLNVFAGSIQPVHVQMHAINEDNNCKIRLLESSSVSPIRNTKAEHTTEGDAKFSRAVAIKNDHETDTSRLDVKQSGMEKKDESSPKDDTNTSGDWHTVHVPPGTKNLDACDVQLPAVAEVKGPDVMVLISHDTARMKVMEVIEVADVKAVNVAMIPTSFNFKSEVALPGTICADTDKGDVDEVPDDVYNVCKDIVDNELDIVVAGMTKAKNVSMGEPSVDLVKNYVPKTDETQKMLESGTGRKSTKEGKQDDTKDAQVLGETASMVGLSDGPSERAAKADKFSHTITENNRCEEKIMDEEAAICSPSVGSPDLVAFNGANRLDEGNPYQRDSREVYKPFNRAKTESLRGMPNKEGCALGLSIPVDPKVTYGSKKKKMDIPAEADAAGTTADLYNAYTASEEKQQDEVKVLELSVANMSSADTLESLAMLEKQLTSAHRECDHLEYLFCTTVTPGLAVDGACDTAGTCQILAPGCLGVEKYTRDFLLKLKDQNRKLPADFEFRADITQLLVSPQAVFFAEPDMLPSLERVLNCQLSGNTTHGSIVGSSDEDRQAVTLHCPGCPESDVEMKPAGIFQRVNSQGLNPTELLDVQTPLGMHAMPVTPCMPPTMLLNPGLVETTMVNVVSWQQMPDGQEGLILSPQTPLASIQTIPELGRVSDEGQRMPDGQKGPILSPQTSPVSIQKAMKRSELGRVSDEEQIKQRKIKGILNKLTPQNFDKLLKQIKDVNVDSVVTLTGLISQISEKALSEPTFCGMYAKLCVHLAVGLPEVFQDGEKFTFKRVLLNKCQEEFQHGERAQGEADEVEEGGQVNLTLKELEEKKHLEAKRRMLGNIIFLGELYKMRMLTERIMHECIRKLLGEGQNFEEENIEALCKLMRTIGQMIDHTKAEGHINTYFKRMTDLCSNQKLPARLRFMLNDIIDLRRNGWQERMKVEGPKKIEEVHRDAVQERQRPVQHVGRPTHGSSVRAAKGKRLVPASNFKMQSPAPPTYIPSTQMGSVTSLGSHKEAQIQIGIHGSYGQFLQQSVDEAPIIRGPQGQPSVLVDVFPLMFLGDSRQSRPGPLSACYSDTVQERGPFLSREYNTQRWVQDEKASTSSESGLSKVPVALNRSVSSSIAPNVSPQQDMCSRPSMPSLGPPSDRHLRKKSESAIIEYFSARDLKEAALCVEDLRSPSFHAMMVSLWISISLEKGDVEQKLLVTLLISLFKAEPSLLEQDQIVRGFEMVLETLEDLAIDTPKAPKLLAGMMGELITQGVMPLGQVGKLLQRDDMLKTGYALDMLGRILKRLREDKGEATMVEMCMSLGIYL